MTYPDVPLPELLRRAAVRFGESTAVVAGERRLSFRQLWTGANQVAHGLLGLGLQLGERVALFLPNCPEYELGFYGALLAGGVATPLNPSYREREVAYQVNETEAAVLFTTPALLPVVDAARRVTPSLRNVVTIGPIFEALTKGQPIEPPAVDVHAGDLAALPFSSGTTNLPKGVMLTHRGLVASHMQFAAGCRMSATDAILIFSPIYHILGLCLVGMAVQSGAKQVLMERFDVHEMARLAREEGITWSFAAPPVYLALANTPDLDPASFRTVKYVFSGAAPLAPDLARRVSDRFGFCVAQSYGLTEGAPTHVPPLDGREIKISSSGVPVPDTEHKVVDLETGERELPAGELGEIAVRGPQVMHGYWRAAEETARVLRDGWFRTGDIGYVDNDGYLYVVDRKKEMIKYKGFAVAPAELEALLLEHPAVRDCGVTGVPEAEAGELPKAFVVLESGSDVTASELSAFVRDRVAGYKQIRLWEVVESIPRTASGKILRRSLRER